MSASDKAYSELDDLRFEFLSHAVRAKRDARKAAELKVIERIAAGEHPPAPFWLAMIEHKQGKGAAVNWRVEFRLSSTPIGLNDLPPGGMSLGKVSAEALEQLKRNVMADEVKQEADDAAR